MAKRQAEWFKDSDFWKEYAPIMFDDAHWAEVQTVADGVIRLARFNLYDMPCAPSLSSGPRILDMCCGIGRISSELARRDCMVTGVDITQNFLETAREEAALDKLKIEYVHSDARKFRRPDYFDLALNLYISFGYFENEDDDLLVLRNICDSLKNGRAFIIETLGKEIAVRDFTESEWFERAGWTVLTEYEVFDSWTRLKNRWILVKDGRRIEKVFTQRLYAASELRDLMYEAGFAEVEIYGDWDESPYDQNAAKLIAVGRKGEK
ncbi:MAG: class I SAM-dependent methyltransferase [Treponema sp.]|nr:class I SAM-dependent methyltransferase [Treponema sp.]